MADVLGEIWRMAARYPDRTAVRSPAGSITYRELTVAAEALAADFGVGHAPVVVYGHKEPAMLTAFLAALRAGRPYLPLDASCPARRLLRCAHIAGADTVFAARPLPPDAGPQLEGEGIRLLDGISGVGRAPAAPADPGRLAYIIFTSGSTGEPKGVPIRLSALGHFLGWLSAQQRLQGGREVVLNQAPLSFDLSVMDIYLSLSLGGTLHAVTAELISRPRELFPWLYGAGLTVWVSTPSFARFCLAEPSFRQESLRDLRRLVFCGETLPAETAAELLRRFPEAEVWNTYGPTETTVAVTSVSVDAGLCRVGPLPVGRPAPGMRVWVVAPDGNPAADGEAGEIAIAGPQVSPGYLRAPAEAGLAGGFGSLHDPDGGEVWGYRTGDAGRLQDGMLYCLGRLDRQVKIRGHRLEPDEIEHLMRSLPGVRDAAVVPALRHGGPGHLVAFVCAEAAGPEPAEDFARAQDLRAALAERLPAYAVPSVFRFLAALPLTSNGKVDRARLAGWLP